MRLSRFLSFIVLGAFSLLSVSCLEQYDPSKNNAKFAAEWKQSTLLPPKLTSTGELPQGGPVVNPEERFQTLCSGCHGPKGLGDGPAGVALTPHPRNFHDKTWQASVDDARIAKVIANGGASVGLSPMMAPWGSVLSPEEIQGLVKKIRVFGKE